MNQARKLEAEQQGRAQKDLIRFNTWLQTEGLYDLAATLVAASEMVGSKKNTQTYQMSVIWKR